MVLLNEPAQVRHPDSIGVEHALEIVHILRRRRATFFVVFLIVTSAATVGALSTPVTYKAESSLLVRMGREYVYRPEVGRTESARTPSLSEIVNSEVEILASRDLAELVVGELGVERLYPELEGPGPDAYLGREKAVLRFREATTVRPVLESSVIKVSYEHEVPQLAADAVNLLVERFKDKHVEVFGEERSSGLEEQFAARRTELAQAEEALADFKRKSGLIDLGKQLDAFIGQRLRLEDELRTCEPAAVALHAEIANGHAEPASAPRLELHTLADAAPPRLAGFEPDSGAAPAAEPMVDKAMQRLLELQLEESELLRDYTPESRKVQSVRAEEQWIQGFLSEAKDRERASDEARRQGLTAELADLDRRITDLYEQEKTLRQLERQLTAAESAEQLVRERVEEARISHELDREKRINVRVIEKAAAPVSPSGLSRSLKIALGVFVGMLAGAAIAVFLDLFRLR